MTRQFTYLGNRYFCAVFAGTFLMWGCGGYMSFDSSLSDFYMLPMLTGLMMPALVATGMIFHQPSSEMKRDFIHRLISLRNLSPSTLLLCIALMPLSVIVSILISLLIGGSVEQFNVSDHFSFTTGFVPVLGLLFLAALFEELGWRGYGFESLEQKFSFTFAAVLFGILWSLWHLPLLWVNNSYQYEVFHLSPWFALNFYVSTAVLGIIVSWVCKANNRSILIAILFHFIVNLSQESLSMTQESKCIQTLLLFFVALIMIRQLKQKQPRESPKP